MLSAKTVRRFYHQAVRVSLAACVAGVLAGCRAETTEWRPRLPALAADVTGTSVSGLSSGAYMAGQFHLAHSRIVNGAALIAGGPYGCAESLFADVVPGPGAAFFNLSKAVNGCMLNSMQGWGTPDVQWLSAFAQKLADRGRIDPIDQVVSDRVYLFSGTNDRTVAPAIVAAAARFYETLGMPVSRIQFENTLAAGHGFVTLDKGLDCRDSGAPYVVNCGYDQAGALLMHLLGSPPAPVRGQSGEVLIFDQREFAADLDGHGLANEGAVYLPRSCQEGGRCRVHIAFHGCGQNRTLAGDAFMTDTGLTAWADAFRLIVLFPQTGVSSLNPQGCWDWWGYTGRDYLTRDAPQIRAVRRMLDRLAGQSSGL